MQRKTDNGQPHEINENLKCLKPNEPVKMHLSVWKFSKQTSSIFNAITDACNSMHFVQFYYLMAIYLPTYAFIWMWNLQFNSTHLLLIFQSVYKIAGTWMRWKSSDNLFYLHSIWCLKIFCFVYAICDVVCVSVILFVSFHWRFYYVLNE